MYKLLVFFGMAILGAHSVVHIDVKQLQCLVCRATLKELDMAVKKIDPAWKVDVGGYRLDADGNVKQKTVSQAKSEVHLSELADEVCNRMDDYVRATWKHSGKLTILRLIDENGQMNTNMGHVDIIQDDDLNKSLKYYCEGIIEEYEESVIAHYKNDVADIDVKVCTEEAQLCSESFYDSDEFEESFEPNEVDESDHSNEHTVDEL